MKQLIFLTGEINSSFFLNEIQYLCKCFDEIIVLAYNGDKSKCDEVAQKYNFKYEFINADSSLIKVIPNFIIWCFHSHVTEEFKTIVKTKNGFKKSLYLLAYGFYSCKTKKVLDKYINGTMSDVYLYSFWLSRFAYTIAQYNINRNSKIKKIVSRAHGYDLYEERNPLCYLPFRSFIAKNIDEIYFISEAGKKYFEKKNYSSNARKDKYKISYLGTNNKIYSFKEKKKNIKIVIASCSSIIQVKRLDLIIDFISMFNPESIRWIHLGAGKLTDKIMEYAKNTLKCTYKFYGNVRNEDILSIYAKENVDFFVNLSDSEGIPVSIMEAMSLGIPVIARNVGGISEIVINKYNGLLLEQAENLSSVFHDLCQEINTIYDTTYNSMAFNAYQTWKNSFNAHQNYCEFVTSLIK